MTASKKTILFKRLIPYILVLVIFVAAGMVIYEFFLKPAPKIQRFILLSLDDLRADRLGCYGNPRNVSPVMDDLAEEGSQFTSAFTPFPFTPPSHLSMLTSLYPSVFDIPLDEKIDTLADLLKKGGFYTAAFTAGGNMSGDYGVMQGFTEQDDKVYYLKDLEQRTLDWLEKHHQEKFFLFLHTYYIHVPYEAPEVYYREFADPSYTGPIGNDRNKTNAFIRAANRKEIHPRARDIEALLTVYDAQIRRADDFVGKIRDSLDKHGIRKNTLFIITSDHGEQFYEHGFFAHTSPSRKLADISTRVPLIISCPRLPNRGPRQEMVELLDIPPTVLEAAGLKIPSLFQGESFFRFLIRKSPFLGSKKEVFFTMPNMIGVRTREWKLDLEPESGRIRLFHMKTDPEEQKDLAETVEGKQHIPFLLSKLRDFREKNSRLREHLELTHIRRAGGLPRRPRAFDTRSRLRISFDEYSYTLRTGPDTIKSLPIQNGLSYNEGKFGKALSLNGKAGTSFPVDMTPAGQNGSLSFWLRVNEGASKQDNIIGLALSGGNATLSLSAAAVWEGRLEVRVRRVSKDGLSHDIDFSPFYRPGRWLHLQLSWRPYEFFLLQNGSLVAGKKIPFFEPLPCSGPASLKITGKGCLIDEIHISDESRLVEVKSQKKLELGPKVLDRLRELGYIK